MGITDDLGKGIGGFLNNPGTVAIVAIIAALVIFRKPIQEAFAGFGGSIANIFSPAGVIADAGEQAGQFVFNIGQDVGGAVFDAGSTIFDAGESAGEAVFGAGQATGDVVGAFLKDAQQQLDNFFKVAGSDISIGTSNLAKDISSGVDPIGKAIGGDFDAIFDFFNNLGKGEPTPEFQGPSIFPETGESTFLDPNRPLDLFSFAEKFGITPAESFGIEKAFGGLDFEAIAAIPTFGEVLAENPQLTASQIANLKLIQAGGGEGFDFGTNTGQALELAGLSFGQGDVNLELLKEAQALQAMESLGGFVGGGLFGNPDFPITAGEAFLGEQGTVVSPSITNLNEQQLKDFIAQFG